MRSCRVHVRRRGIPMRGYCTSTTQQTHSQSSRMPDSYWKDPMNEKRFLDEFIERKIGSTNKLTNEEKLAAWYAVTTKELQSAGGATLLKKYKNSLIGALRQNYPNHEWQEWRFKKTPQRYWKDLNNHQQFLRYIAEKYDFKNLEDWYKLTHQMVQECGGSALLRNYYKDSPYLFVTSLIKDHQWLPWKFVNVSQAYWKPKENRRKFVDWLTRDVLGFKTFEEWYSLSGDTFREHGGGGLIFRYYKCSVYKALADLYPEHKWNPSRFQKPPKQLWENVLKDIQFDGGNTSSVTQDKDFNSKRIIADYVHHLERVLDISRPEEWYRISRRQLLKSGGIYMIDKFGGLKNVLPLVYPQYNWDVSRLVDRTKKSQKLALYSIKEAFR